MTDPFPRYLYRYRSLSSTDQVIKELDALENSFLWFSSFDALNDPAELADTDIKKFPFLADVALRVMLKDPKGKVAKVMNNRAKYLSSGWMNKKSSGVCCFAERGDHQAMWAYYAGGFTGMCVKYDMHKLLSLENFCWGSKPLKVKYNEQRLVSAENTIDFGSKTSEGTISLSTKHPDWSHEQEWRLLKREEFGKNYHTSNAITEVILGAKIEPQNAEQLKELCERREIACSAAAFNGHVMTIMASKQRLQKGKVVLAKLTDKAEKQAKEMISKGYDKYSLNLAVKTARKYPGAKSIFLLTLSDELECLYVYILFELTNKKEEVKRIKFAVDGKKFSKDFTYSI